MANLQGRGGLGLSRAWLLDQSLSWASIGPPDCQRYWEAWPTLIKCGTRAAAAVSSTAARAPVGQVEAELGGCVDFSCSVSRPGIWPQAQETRRIPPPAQKCELTLVWGARHLLANSHPQRRTLRDGKWRIAAAAATRGTAAARCPQTWPPLGREGSTPFLQQPQPALHGRGRGVGGPTFMALSPLACGAPGSGFGNSEARDRAKVGHGGTKWGGGGSRPFLV